MDGCIDCDQNKIKLPRIGWVKTYERLPLRSKPSSVRITRTAEDWFVSFKVEVQPTQTPKLRETIGVDLGLATLATLSDGTEWHSPRPYSKLEKR